MLAEKLMQDDAKDIVEAVLKAAKGGDMTAARMVLDRIAPARKGRPVEFELPAIERRWIWFRRSRPWFLRWRREN